LDSSPRRLTPAGISDAAEAQSDAVLFSLSDRPAQQVLGLWRERVPDA